MHLVCLLILPLVSAAVDRPLELDRAAEALRLRSLLEAAGAAVERDPLDAVSALLEFRELFLSAAPGAMPADEESALARSYALALAQCAGRLRELPPEAINSLDAGRQLLLLRFERLVRRRFREGAVSVLLLERLAAGAGPVVVRLAAARALATSGDTAALASVLAEVQPPLTLEWLEAMAALAASGAEADAHLASLAGVAHMLKARDASAFERTLAAFGAAERQRFLALLAAGNGRIPEGLASAIGRWLPGAPAAAAGIWQRLDERGRIRLLEGALRAAPPTPEATAALARLDGVPAVYRDCLMAASGDYEAARSLLAAANSRQPARAVAAARLLYLTGNPAGVPIVIECVERAGLVGRAAALAAAGATGMIQDVHLDAALAAADTADMWRWWRRRAADLTPGISGTDNDD